MFGDWPRIAWTALRTLSVRPLAALFAERARTHTQLQESAREA
jgi:hypothetical protein